MDYYQRLRGERNRYIGQHHVLNNPVTNKIRAAHERKGIFQDKWIYRGKNLNNLDVKNDPNRGIRNIRNWVFNFLRETIGNNVPKSPELTKSLNALLQNKDLIDDGCIEKLYFDGIKCQQSDANEHDWQNLEKYIVDTALRIEVFSFLKTHEENEKLPEDVRNAISTLLQNKDLIDSSIINYLHEAQDISGSDYNKTIDSIKTAASHVKEVKRQFVFQFLENSDYSVAEKNTKESFQLILQRQDLIDDSDVNTLYKNCADWESANTNGDSTKAQSVVRDLTMCVINSASKIKKQVVTSFLDENIGKDLPRQIKNAIQILSRNKDSLNRESINKLYLLCSKDLRKGSNKKMLIDYLLNEAEQINKAKFAKNNKTLNAKNKAENFLGNIRKGAKLGEGGLGAVYELRNDKDYVIKVPHAKNYGELLRGNIEAKKELQKAEKLRGIIENYIKDYNFAGAQGLENAAAPVLITQAQVGFNKINELVMPKAEGKDGDKFIFGDPEKGKAPIGIYGNKVGYDDFTITSRRAALSIALQKAMILRALNDGGYANIDTKLENIMISEDGKVSMIDLGSIVKQGNGINVYTPITKAPEVDFNKPAGPKADVFSDAIDRPYVLFGSIANKYLPRFQDHAKLFTRCEGATDNDVQTAKMKYIGSGLQEPTFPEYFTNAQKIRYMYYHFGFLKIQKETGEIYPPEVLDSLAKLQALSTEPDSEKRISERVVEDVLLNLMASIDRWRNGIYRIEGAKITPGSMTDEILPKNKSVNKENIQQNNKNRGNRIQNVIQEIRLIRNDRVKNKKAR